MIKIIAVTKWIEKINTWLAKIFAWGIVIVVASILLDMVTRHVFDTPQAWCHEFALLIFGPYLILGGAYTVITDNHIKMDIFSSKWSEKTRAIVHAVIMPFVLAALAILLRLSTIITIDAIGHWERSGSLWNPVIWPVTMAVPVATFLLMVQLIATTLKELLLSFKKAEED